jgi:D-sedoheptulose 7-phosphate isomerase
VQNDKKIFTNYAQRISEILAHVNPSDVANLLKCITNTISRNGTLYVLGNGGSASTSSHFVNDLTVVAKRRKVYINAISLADNSAIITAIGNDEGFENIFEKQLQGNLKKEDLIFCISASGNSQNLVNAVKYAANLGVETAALLGFNGGILMSIADQTCLVRTRDGEYGPTEDVHLSICHFLAENI